MEQLTTGLTFVDELLDGGLRPGDSVLLLAERGTPRLAVMQAFLDVQAPHTVVVDVTGAWSDRRGSAVTVLDWSHLRGAGEPSSGDGPPTSTQPGPEGLTRQFVEVESETGSGTYWLFDSLTAMQDGLGSGDTLAVFLVVCPRLYRRGSVALLPVDPDEHDRAFLERLRSTVQVVLELRPSPAGTQLEVTKADGRPTGTVGRRVTFRVEDGEFDVGAISSGIQRIGAQLRAERLNRGMSQAELGRLVGISGSAISQFERGVTGVSGYVLTRLWQALEVPFGPSDQRRRGFRIVRRGEMHRNDLAAGVSATLLFDHPDVGLGWDLTIAPTTSRPSGMFSVKATEIVLVRRGVFDLVMGGEHHTLSEGDSLVTTQQAITGWQNPARRPTQLLWFVLGRAHDRRATAD